MNKTRESIAKLNQSQEIYEYSSVTDGIIPTSAPTPYNELSIPNDSEEAVAVFEENSGEIAKEQTFIMPTDGEILCGFSGDNLVYDKTMKDWRTHNGIDIAVDEGGFICAAGDGIIIKSYDDELNGYTIEIDHGDGIVSIYCGVDKTTALKEGEEVKMGDLIARVGETGIAESLLKPHIHFEMKKDGKYVSPEDYILK